MHVLVREYVCKCISMSDTVSGKYQVHVNKTFAGVDGKNLEDFTGVESRKNIFDGVKEICLREKCILRPQTVSCWSHDIVVDLEKVLFARWEGKSV